VRAKGAEKEKGTRRGKIVKKTFSLEKIGVQGNDLQGA